VVAFKIHQVDLPAVDPEDIAQVVHQVDPVDTARVAHLVSDLVHQAQVVSVVHQAPDPVDFLDLLVHPVASVPVDQADSTLDRQDHLVDSQVALVVTVVHPVLDPEALVQVVHLDHLVDSVDLLDHLSVDPIATAQVAHLDHLEDSPVVQAAVHLSALAQVVSVDHQVDHVASAQVDLVHQVDHLVDSADLPDHLSVGLTATAQVVLLPDPADSLDLPAHPVASAQVDLLDHLSVDLVASDHLPVHPADSLALQDHLEDSPVVQAAVRPSALAQVVSVVHQVDHVASAQVDLVHQVDHVDSAPVEVVVSVVHPVEAGQARTSALDSAAALDPVTPLDLDQVDLADHRHMVADHRHMPQHTLIFRDSVNTKFVVKIFKISTLDEAPLHSNTFSNLYNCL